ncbi:YqgE/AlgH family protein [Robiginitomaculum antarcticum]|uniref:YqgE/AlgH family protein n=1 Tax=Robiginitomaculum antarcticum TaxID=437507 RepID=UPI000367F6EB|nr:YqgE/AlgH family protein [Robiginitomaculum antarcticum]
MLAINRRAVLCWAMSFETQYLGGQILIATPAMLDPRFARSIIMMCLHDDDGAMGVVLNNPQPRVNLGEILKQSGVEGPNAARPRPVFNGGPVGRERGFVLHSDDFFSLESSIRVRDGLVLTSTKDVLLALAGESPPERAIFALGYAGWSPGQLEAELGVNAWLIAEGTDALIYDTKPEKMWEAALAQIGIKPSQLSMFSGSA